MPSIATKKRTYKLRTAHKTHRASVMALGTFLLIQAGCSKGGPTTLGITPAVTATMTVSTAVHGKQGEKCTLKGEMIEKCPTAGCWFILKDKTGTLHIDTKSAGFVVTSVPVHTEVTVTGVLQADPGQPATLTASGVRY